jgi:lysophospholipase L1-like esterase
MVQGYGGGRDFNMPRLYDEVAINAIKGWDYTRFQPQVVVIDLGSNDLSAPLDSALFVASYVEFLKRIRNNYAPAKIICVAGPSSPEDETWEKWKAYVYAVVDQYRQKDDNVYCFEFSTFKPNGSDWHPNVEEHRRMAGELVPFVKELMKW